MDTVLLFKRAEAVVAEAKQLLEENWQCRRQVWRSLAETRRIQSMPCSLQDRASEPAQITAPPALEE
jgi:hypothetical protein